MNGKSGRQRDKILLSLRLSCFWLWIRAQKENRERGSGEFGRVGALL